MAKRELTDTQLQMLQIMFINSNYSLNLSNKIEKMVGDLLKIKKFLNKKRHINDFKPAQLSAETGE